MDERETGEEYVRPRSGDRELHAAVLPEGYPLPDPEESGYSPLFLLAIVLLVAAFAGVLFFAYQQGMKEGLRSAPPLLRADRSPVKVKPLNPGGITIPHQDKRVYDRIEGIANKGKQGLERLLPPAEEPVDLPRGMPSGEGLVDKSPSQVEILPLSAPGGAAARQEKPEPPAKDPPPEIRKAQQKAIPLPAERISPINGGQTGQSLTNEVGTVPVPGVPAAASGNFVVQIAALRKREGADRRFRALKARHEVLFRNVQADIQRADLGEKGIYYRLRIGYFGDNKSAGDFCARLKSRNVDCLVKER